MPKFGTLGVKFGKKQKNRVSNLILLGVKFAQTLINTDFLGDQI